MKFLNQLERKFGRYAIPDLINYVVGLCALGAFISYVSPTFYVQYLALDIGKVMEGQVWRLITFIIDPYDFSTFLSFIFLFFKLKVYHMIGKSLENAWGAFRFNLYFISGILFSILGAVILYVVYDQTYYGGLDYVYQSMFLAFATIYPNIQFLFNFIIPIKVKYLAYLYGAFLLFSVVSNLGRGNYGMAFSIIVAMANFLIFFLTTRNYRRVSPAEYRRKKKFKREVKQSVSGQRHKCAVCGRTELDDENLEFRYCSKCDGNYEYCMEHLFTHEHVHK